MLDVFVQIDNKGVFIGDYAYTAYEGFKFLGHNTHMFQDASNIPVGINEYRQPPLVVGTIEETEKYLKMSKVVVPLPLHIPPALEGHAHRNIQHLTLGEAKNLKPPYFIKTQDLKVFPSGVYRGIVSFNEMFGQYPEDTRVIISDVIDMVSEYRVFVLDNVPIGVRHYIGDPMIFPSAQTIRLMIKDFRFSPRAYTLDVAVTPEGHTVLIECNDGWSVGSYGLDGELYAKFLKARWQELFKKNKFGG